MEPVYEFVRGQGWVASAPGVLVITQSYNGETLRVMQRNPNVGERWFRISRTGPWMLNGKPSIEKIKEYISENVLGDLSVRSDLTFNTGYIYFTVERV